MGVPLPVFFPFRIRFFLGLLFLFFPYIASPSILKGRPPLKILSLFSFLVVTRRVLGYRCDGIIPSRAFSVEGPHSFTSFFGTFISGP